MSKPSDLLGALVVCALELHPIVTVSRGDRPGEDAALIVSPSAHRGRLGDVHEVRVDGQLLEGARAEAYVDELVGMMRRCPLAEWPTRAEAIARMLSDGRWVLHLPDKAPPTRVLLGPVEAKVGGEVHQLRSREEVLQLFGKGSWVGRVAADLAFPKVPAQPQLPVGPPPPRQLPRPLRKTTVLTLDVDAGPARAALSALREDFDGIFGPGPMKARAGAARLLSLELDELLDRLRGFHGGSGSKADPPAPDPRCVPGDLELTELTSDEIEDCSFLLRYLSVAGDHARFIADLMLRGGLSTPALARVWRQTYQETPPEEWP